MAIDTRRVRTSTTIVGLALGCAASASPPASDVTVDATVDRAPAAASVDATAAADRDAPRAIADEAVAVLDPASPVDVAIDPGACGPLTRACLCECGGAGPCQNGCIARNETCGLCVFAAATRCCPDEWRVLDDCITRRLCADDPCIAARCGVDQRRLETCFSARQMGDEACRAVMRGCLGSDYPMIRCAVRP